MWVSGLGFRFRAYDSHFLVSVLYAGLQNTDMVERMNLEGPSGHTGTPQPQTPQPICLIIESFGAGPEALKD